MPFFIILKYISGIFIKTFPFVAVGIFFVFNSRACDRAIFNHSFFGDRVWERGLSCLAPDGLEGGEAQVLRQTRKFCARWLQ